MSLYSGKESGRGQSTLPLEDTILSKEAVLNFSIDSGMEDPPPQSQGTSDDSDDDVVCRRKVKKRAILDDDNSDDNGDDCNDVDEEPKEKNPGLHPSGENKENVPVTSESNDKESGDDNDDDDDLKLNLEMENENEVPVEKGIEDDNEIDDGSVEPSSSRIEFKDRDIFDAESDDEQRPVLTDDEGSDRNSSQDNDGNGDEGFDESQVDPALLAKLKKLKGASKTPKQKEKLNRKAKPTAEQMTELYSESQRMLRDSRVNLPYYEPEAKSLDDFLARASKKKEEYSTLSKPRDFQKALIIQEKLAVTPPKQSPGEKAKGSKLSLKNKDASSDIQQESTVPVVNSHDSRVESQDLGLSQAGTVILSESISTTGCASVPLCDESNDNEELPDINPIPHTDSSTHLANKVAPTPQVNFSRLSPTNNDSHVVEVVNGEEENCTGEITEIVNLQKDPSRDLFNSQTTKEQIEEELFQKVIKDVEDHDLCIERENVGEDCNDTESYPKTEAHKNSESCEIINDNEQHIQSQEKQIFGESVDSTKSLDAAEKVDNEVSSLNCQEVKDQLDDKCDTSNIKYNKLSLREKLEQQGLMVPELPKLSGSPDSVINLDNEEHTKTPTNTGVMKLMDRLIQHKTKKKPHASYDVNLSIIEKESGEGEQKELKLKSLTYHVEEEKEEIPSTAPGAKLALLKEKLGVGMKIKREEARLRRQEMFNIENEEGFEGGSKSEEEQEEAEMTDDESSSDEEEEEDGLFGMMDGSDDGEDYNPLLDTEAKDDEEEEEEEDIFGMEEDSNDVKLRFEVSDEDEDDSFKDEKDNGDDDHENDATQILKEEDEITPVKGKKKSCHRVLSDDEEDSKSHHETSIQGTYFNDNESLPDIELTPLTKHFQDTQYHRESTRSPDLYGPSQFEENSNSTRPGDNLNDSGSNYNPHSQMLDADGYLKMTPSQRPPKSRISLLVDAPETEDNAIMDGFDSSCKMTAGKIFGGMSGLIDSQADNMSVLLGLCSGTFQQNSLSEDAINPSQNRRYEEDENELSNPFHTVNDEEDDSENTGKRKRIKPMLSDSEEERDGDTEIEDDDDDASRHSGTEKFSGFKDKITKGIRKEFLEDEAELSGSEFDSDENVDLAEEDDILEEEAGDRDMAGVSEEELRNQVGKVHMKQLLDDDDRAVMRFKEMYLQDGDLHSDGNGRMRHFRWKDSGDSSQQDMFHHQSDEENVEEDAEEIKWRKERMEREKFIEESQQGEEEPNNKELQKFGQVFVKRSDSTSSLQKTPTIQQNPSMSKQPSMKKKGSFLSRGKAALVQFAHISKTALGGNSKQNSRSFVFQAKENQEEENDEKHEIMPQPIQPPKRKAHSVPSGSTPQVSKKPRLSTNSSQAPPPVKRGGSIFNLLDK